MLRAKHIDIPAQAEETGKVAEVTAMDSKDDDGQATSSGEAELLAAKLKAALKATVMTEPISKQEEVWWSKKVLEGVQSKLQ